MSQAAAGPGTGVSEPLTIRSVDAVLVVVPMRRALGTSAMGIAEAPLVLIDVQPRTARARCRQLDGEGLYWIEEPVRHDDYATSAELATLLRTPVQIGENFTSPRAMSLALQRKASDLVMPDLERIGGISGWLDAAALANAAGTEMSAHLYPEVSAHLLAATPTAHWAEYVDWANPILEQPLQVTDGCVVPPDRPGTGLTWNTDAISHYRRS